MRVGAKNQEIDQNGSGDIFGFWNLVLKQKGRSKGSDFLQSKVFFLYRLAKLDRTGSTNTRESRILGLQQRSRKKGESQLSRY
ncbi:hypothetical protein HWI79_301 [Cryptosporidium felis]|nr:hypothetical protein HWI79_301 [Cryptosporidium felis]